MGQAKNLKTKWSKVNEQEGVIATWTRQTGAGLVSSGTKSYEVNPELVKSFGDEKQAIEGLACDFEVGTIDGKEVVTSISLKA